jgi:hypothetical protein
VTAYKLELDESAMWTAVALFKYARFIGHDDNTKRKKNYFLGIKIPTYYSM